MTTIFTIQNRTISKNLNFKYLILQNLMCLKLYFKFGTVEGNDFQSESVYFD